MNNRDKIITEFVLSALRYMLDNLSDDKAKAFMNNRVDYYSNRLCVNNVSNNEPLSLAELTEFHDIIDTYSIALRSISCSIHYRMAVRQFKYYLARLANVEV